jgi:outer membrane protein assembly factor BamB
MKRFGLIVLTDSLVAVAGCHSFKKENIQPPTPLDKNFQPTVKTAQVWKTRVGHGAGVSGVRMQPTVVGDVVYAASTDGVIGAYDAATGKTIWENKTRTHGWFGWGDKHRKDAFYSGGPAVSGDLLVIGTLNGHVYGFNVKDGTQRWDSTLPSEVIDSPTIAGALTIVRTQDGRVYGLDSTSGERRWVNDQGNVPLLSLRGNGPLLVANGVVFFGSDDGKLTALRLDKLASGEGRTDIDRMNDADGSVILDGSTLYAAAYHGNLTSIDGPSGRPVWARPFSTYTSMAIAGNSLLGANTDSQVWAFDKSSGADMWKNDNLKYRWITAPAVQSDYVVVGDIEGYVHWLQVGDGALAGRQRLSKKAIRAQPVVAGDLVYIEDVQGHLAAYRLGAK